MKVNFDSIRQKLIDRTNRVMKKMWTLHETIMESEYPGNFTDEMDELERALDLLRDPVVAIGCLESDGSADDPFKALEFDIHAARKEDEE
jgi:hypothetical protein